MRIPRRTAWTLAVLSALGLQPRLVAQTPRTAPVSRPSPYMSRGSAPSSITRPSPYGVIRYDRPAKAQADPAAPVHASAPSDKPMVESCLKPVAPAEPADIAQSHTPEGTLEPITQPAPASIAAAPATPNMLPDDKPTATMLPEIEDNAHGKQERTAAGILTLSKPAGTAFTVEECQACLRNVEIMIAWLADPVTFPYALEARSVNDGVEVCGTVPTGQEWAQAMRIAREYSEVMVKHAIVIEPRDRALVRIDAAELKDKTNEALKDVVIHGLVVETDDQGQVSLQGQVTSFEDRLAASRRMQKVAGCRCVQNGLVVLPVSCGGVPCVMVTADGKCVLPVSELPARLTTGLTRVRADMPAVSAVPTQPSPLSQGTLVEAAAGTMPVHYLPSRRFSLRKLLRGDSHLEVIEIRPAENVPVSQLPAPATVAEESVLPETALADQPAGLETAAVAKEGPVPAQDKPAPMRLPTNFAVVKTKVQQFDRMDTGFASEHQPRELPDVLEAESTMAAKPRVDSAVQQVKAETPSLAPTIDWDHAAMQLNLQKQIEKECGEDASDVWVLLRSSKSLLITLKAFNGADGERCARRILRMPSLAPYQVSLEVEVVSDEAAAR